MKKGRGRRRGQRWITEIPEKKWFAPEGAEEENAINLNFEELEAIRLVDLLELQQQEAAVYMGISRKAFWNDLRSARKKVATSLVYGLGIKIGGGSYALRDEIRDSKPTRQDLKISVQSSTNEDKIAILKREMLLVEERQNRISSRIKALRKKSD
ncbi:MAG: DUF134 domain-containing protein [Methanotrichaceae archaeon]